MKRAAEVPWTGRDAGRAELHRALGSLLDAPAPEHVPVAEALGLPPFPDTAEHTRLFTLNLHPYASVSLGSEGMLGGEARDRVAGFWRAVGLTPPAEPDHLGALLGLLASLEERERDAASGAEAALVARARRTLLGEHLLPWVPFWLGRVQELGGPFHRSWAALLGRVLAEAWDASGGAEEGEPLPASLRELPPLPDPRTEGEGAGPTFLRALLAPARSGVFLTRQDLARAGRSLGLGLRLGERAYVLQALLSQDAVATLAWLAGEARRQAEAHRVTGPHPPLSAFWSRRAGATAELLDALAAAAASSEPTTPPPGADLPMETHHA